MIHVVYYDEAGCIHRAEGLDTEEDVVLEEGLSVLQVSSPVLEDSYVDLELGEVVAKPPSPGPAWKWDYESKSWAKDSATAAKLMRAKRDTLLAESDWTQLQDTPPTKRGRWAQYRQALRDVPQQPGFPETVTWPEPPE